MSANMMPSPSHASDRTTAAADLWAQRRRANVRLGVLFGAIALVIFLASLWKYRPL